VEFKTCLDVPFIHEVILLFELNILCYLNSLLE
jgi:hypothetical protein